MEIVEIKRIGPINSNPVFHLTRKDEGDAEIYNQYAFTRGAVIWPFEDVNGFVLVAGKELDSNCVEVFEEHEFVGLQGAAAAFMECCKYLPHIYYYNDIPENQGFINHLRKYPKLSGKLPFCPAPNPEGVDYGNSLIADYLEKRLLVVPPDGILSKQLREARQESGAGDYALTALRYLLQGMDANPWYFEVLDLDFSGCLV